MGIYFGRHIGNWQDSFDHLGGLFYAWEYGGLSIKQP